MMTDPLESLRVFIAATVRSELGKLASEPADEYLSTGDAAKFAAVATGTIRRWVRTGKLREHRAGRLVRVSRQDLQRMMAESRPRNDVSPERAARRKYG